MVSVAHVKSAILIIFQPPTITKLYILPMQPSRYYFQQFTHQALHATILMTRVNKIKSFLISFFGKKLASQM